MDKNTKDILESLNFIKEQMLAKDDIRDVIHEEVPEIVREELKPIHAEVKDIRREVEQIKKDVHNVSGYGKEIDHALERIARIEKHLGLDKVAA